MTPLNVKTLHPNDTDGATAWWERNGYLAGRPIGDGLWICLASMIFTNRLMVCDEWTVFDFWCYPHELGLSVAREAWSTWDGIGEPIEGWVRGHVNGQDIRKGTHIDGR